MSVWQTSKHTHGSRQRQLNWNVKLPGIQSLGRSYPYKSTTKDISKAPRYGNCLHQSLSPAPEVNPRQDGVHNLSTTVLCLLFFGVSMETAKAW